MYKWIYPAQFIWFLNLRMFSAGHWGLETLPGSASLEKNAFFQQLLSS